MKMLWVTCVFRQSNCTDLSRSNQFRRVGIGAAQIARSRSSIAVPIEGILPGRLVIFVLFGVMLFFFFCISCCLSPLVTAQLLIGCVGSGYQRQWVA